jgi:hypothetical protein
MAQASLSPAPNIQPSHKHQISIVRSMDFLDHVDLKSVHSIHPVHHLDADENFSWPAPEWVRRKWVAGGIKWNSGSREL